ncbi:hypothetical protein E2C01_070778 [Portunus trituberculatus]|uniref:Uncharacterized protein n=1 Tax=Portunus trituberculatus TaxID=210409 RepID=A0A5B7I673_PORTR|nr:hypothetical protein [Portunus trituberculatus]
MYMETCHASEEIKITIRKRSHITSVTLEDDSGERTKLF